MSLANCNLTTLQAAAKCFDCLSLTEKEDLKVRFMAEALKASGGTDLTNINDLKKAVACLACEPDFRLDSMEVAIWLSLAQAFGATLPTGIADLKALVKCWTCGEQKTVRAGFTYLLCRLASIELVPCWVAREVYGVTNPRWLMFWAWLSTAAPKWFYRLYVKFGPGFARFIANKPTLKSAIRRWMDSRIAAT